MEYKFDDLEIGAKPVIHYFEEISAIPHGSGNTKGISDYLAGFAKEHGLRHIQDRAGNVIIFKDASKGAEKSATLILQGHMDMVCEKEADVSIDMEKEPISLQLDADGDTLRAQGTTLGADNGIGIAIMLAVLDNDELLHPPLECIATVDEETGMLGCAELDCSTLSGRKLLNLDSEDEGVFVAGCAGGTTLTSFLPADTKTREGTPLTITVTGLKGGHSGEMINEGRASANQVLGRLLSALRRAYPCRLISVNGGTKDNAITREAVAKILFKPGRTHAEIEEWLTCFDKTLKDEYQFTDPGISVNYMWEEDHVCDVIRKGEARKIAAFLCTFPYGVQEYSPVSKNLPQTSLNLGILKTLGHEISATFLIRSSIDSQKDMETDRVRALTKALGGLSKVESTYPAWEFRKDSAFRDKITEIYKKQTGKDAKIDIIHGGVECGLICGKIPGLDAVSAGPDIYDIHTPAEHISLKSIDRFYTFVLELLKEIAK
ncbi:MAG: aminoacyl-histidine dipeptidase [Lachnospiraceae bacterium]|jgi:dipeptidase D|nr:aminoacyl-histidine dipeptidase [Lachnospiraceae bacterium]